MTAHTPSIPENTTAFDSAEDAWFWFIAAQAALNDGATVRRGQALQPRPCEPSDIYRVLDQLYRTRKITWEQIETLKHFGDRMMPPDAYRNNETRARPMDGVHWTLWSKCSSARAS